MGSLEGAFLDFPWNLLWSWWSLLCTAPSQASALLRPCGVPGRGRHVHTACARGQAVSQVREPVQAPPGGVLLFQCQCQHPWRVAVPHSCWHPRRLANHLGKAPQSMRTVQSNTSSAHGRAVTPGRAHFWPGWGGDQVEGGGGVKGEGECVWVGGGSSVHVSK